MDWISRFEGLSNLPQSQKDQLIADTQVLTVPKGTVIFGPGKAPENLLLLLDGTVRVSQMSEAGREIVLYRVTAGESCVLTTACLLAYEEYSAEGVAETDVQAAAVPRRVFDRLISESKDFRRFVFSAYSKRITDLFVVIEEVAFKRIDIRLAQRLLELKDSADKIQATHQNLAVELGSAREVISRQLQEFQRRGWVKANRGEIEILDNNQLKTLAGSS
ncbi:MAG: Crp/Fnr family transcriptional regulator [Amylibacter sp.]|nr:Crp/Fnr family transcriptional regulator [Amylibacter sp.]